MIVEPKPITSNCTPKTVMLWDRFDDQRLQLKDQLWEVKFYKTKKLTLIVNPSFLFNWHINAPVCIYFSNIYYLWLWEGHTWTLNLDVVNIDTALNEALQELLSKSMLSNDKKIIFSVYFRWKSYICVALVNVACNKVKNRKWLFLI
jgi:hypothetical protein